MALAKQSSKNCFKKFVNRFIPVKTSVGACHLIRQELILAKTKAEFRNSNADLYKFKTKLTFIFRLLQQLSNRPVVEFPGLRQQASSWLLQTINNDFSCNI